MSASSESWGLPSVPRWDYFNSFHETIPNCCSLRKTWACGRTQSERERMAHKVIQDEYLRLGPMSYAEMNVLALFILMVVLWFTRDPRFMDGWATHLFNAKAEWVQKYRIAVKLQKCVFPVCEAISCLFLWTIKLKSLEVFLLKKGKFIEKRELINVAIIIRLKFIYLGRH